QIVLGNDKAIAGGRGDDALLARAIDEEVDDVLALVDVDNDAHRLALTASAGQLVGAYRIDLAPGGEHEQLVGGFALDGELEPVSGLEAALVICLHGMAARRADPALLGENDGDRLALDERFGDFGSV